MTRKTLSRIVGGLGTLMAVGMLIGISLMGSWTADASTESVAGPGVDIHVRTPFPGPGDSVVLEVSGRGGSAAGVREARVFHRGVALVEGRGRGKHWGSVISGSGSRGGDTVDLSFRVPDGYEAGSRLSLRVDVSYVVALSSVGSFTNEEFEASVPLTVALYSESGRTAAQLGVVALAVAMLGAWFLLCFGLAYLYWSLDNGGYQPEVAQDAAEMEGIGLLLGVIGMGMLGYWFFARSLMGALGLQSTLWTVLLTGGWVVLPVLSAWLWARRRPTFSRYGLATPVGVLAPPLLEPVELERVLDRELGYRVKPAIRSLRARRDKTWLQVRWAGDPIAPEKMLLRATETRAVLELALALTRTYGRLSLRTAGVTVEIDPERSVDELEKTYVDELGASSKRLLAVLPDMRSLARGLFSKHHER